MTITRIPATHRAHALRPGAPVNGAPLAAHGIIIQGDLFADGRPVVIEGTPDELLAFAERVLDAAREPMRYTATPVPAGTQLVCPQCLNNDALESIENVSMHYRAHFHVNPGHRVYADYLDGDRRIVDDGEFIGHVWCRTCDTDLDARDLVAL